MVVTVWQNAARAVGWIWELGVKDTKAGIHTLQVSSAFLKINENSLEECTMVMDFTRRKELTKQLKSILRCSIQLHYTCIINNKVFLNSKEKKTTFNWF